MNCNITKTKTQGNSKKGGQIRHQLFYNQCLLIIEDNVISTNKDFDPSKVL